MSRKSNRRLCLVLDALMLVAVATLIAYTCSRTHSGHYDLDRSVFPVKGIDVSAHNGNIDFGRVAEDTVSFVYIKATEGTDFCDANFSVNYHNARNAGLMVGPYHFFRFDTPADEQVSHLLMSISGLTFDLPIAIDVEEWGNPDNYEIETVRQGLRLVIDTVRAAGYPVIIYTNKRGYKLYVKGYFDDIPLWLCALSANVPAKATIWQHSHKSHIRGISGDVDQNTYNGSRDAFSSFINQYTVQ